MVKAIFLDRDGVICKLCYDHEKGIYSPKDMDEFKLIPHVKSSIKKLKQKGFLIIVVSNQPGIAFGHIKQKDLDIIDIFLKEQLGIDEVYNCIHHPEVNGACSCRKPKDGLLRLAKKEFDIDFSKSYMIGDNLTDIKAGHKCKKTFLIAKKKSVALLNFIEEMKIYPSYIVGSLEEATKKITSF